MSENLPAVLYLHGFGSSPDSPKARQFKDYFHTRQLATVVAPALPHDPAQALLLLHDLMQSRKAPLLLVGSSLGGFYATCLTERYGVKSVLINPAVAPHMQSEKFLGWHRNAYTGEDFEFTRAHAEALRRMAVQNIRVPELYLLLLQSGDEILDYRQALDFYEGCSQLIQLGGSHSFDNFAAMLPLVSRFAELEGTE